LPRRLQLAADALQDLEVAPPPLAEAEARAGPDLTGAKVVDQDLLDEFLRRQRGHRLAEAQQANVVRAQLAQPEHLGARGQQARWRLALGEQLTREGFEAQRNGRQSQFAGTP